MAINSIKSGGSVVLVNTVVETYNDADLEFDLTIGGENLVLVISFLTDDLGKTHYKTTVSEDSKRLVVQFYNAPISLSGTGTPLEVGDTTGGKKIFLTVRSQKLGSSRTVFMTLFQQE